MDGQSTEHVAAEFSSLDGQSGHGPGNGFISGLIKSQEESDFSLGVYDDEGRMFINWAPEEVLFSLPVVGQATLGKILTLRKSCSITKDLLCGVIGLSSDVMYQINFTPVLKTLDHDNSEIHFIEGHEKLYEMVNEKNGGRYASIQQKAGRPNSWIYLSNPEFGFPVQDLAK